MTSDETERMAEIIHQGNPFTIDGVALDWGHVVQSHLARAAVYREAARNRVRAAAAMERLNGQPAKRVLTADS